MKIAAGYQPILTAIENFQCMTVLQLATLFSMNIKVMQKKLRKLHNYGYLERTKLPGITSGNSPYLYYFHTSKPRFSYRLSHSLRNTDLMIEVILSFKNTQFHCDYLPEHLIRTANQEIIPDGAFSLKNSKQALFLLENCSGTEIVRSPSLNEDIESKLIRYVELFEKDNIQFYRNYFNCNFNRFRLLYITNNSQRSSIIANVIKEHDKHGFIWLSTKNNLKKHSIQGNIWQIPATNKFNCSII